MDSPSHSDLESTSTLFSRLDLIETSSRHKDMGSVDTHLMFATNSPDSFRRESAVEEVHTPSSNLKLVSARKIHYNGTNSVDKSRKNPSLVTCHNRYRGSKRKKWKEQLPVFGGDAGSHSRYKGRGIASNNDALQLDLSQRNLGHGGPLDGASFHPVYVASPGSEGNVADKKGKVVMVDNTASYSHCVKAKPLHGVGQAVHNKSLDGPSSHEVHIISPDSDGNHADRKKGKAVMGDNTKNYRHYTNAKPHPGRVCSVLGKKAIADEGDVFRSNKVQEGRGVSKRENDACNYLSAHSHEVEEHTNAYGNLVHDNPEKFASLHRLNTITGRATTESESENARRRRRRKLMKGKKKFNSVLSGGSSSILEESETSYFPGPVHPSNSKLMTACDSQHRDITFRSTIEIDELKSPKTRCTNLQEQDCTLPFDCSEMASQVESDEILARQLQEQFYHELLTFGGTEEIDANVAWSLQQEDARQVAHIARQGQSERRDASMAHLYAHYPRSSFQDLSAQSTNHNRAPASNRRNYYSSEMDVETRMLAEVRRNFNSAEMDLEMRHNILEALEAAFDNSSDMFAENVLQIHDDFNEDDYEMLLTLDENINHAGASESQINSLPHSIMQSDNVGETCAICLEAPSVGDIIRHLPCLHKFHKECIDPWLRRRTSCPVCKSDITHL